MVYILEKLFKRDLNLLLKEVESFKEDANLWKVAPGVRNPAGNLALHICGELRHYIGSIIGKVPYTRDRNLEFKAKDVPSRELVTNVEKTTHVVLAVIQGLSNYDLKKTYPISLWNESFSIEFFLIHLHSHLNYHLGQINYLRRILEGTKFVDNSQYISATKGNGNW